MSTEKLIRNSLFQDVIVEGPIPVTEDSYPFCSMEHCRKPYKLSDLGYVEEEYFISGFANVYEEDGEDAMRIVNQQLPYKTRIIVRRPADLRKFSGRLYLDILNATNRYDHEDLWTRIYQWCVEKGHAYVGITSKPVNVEALKIFDYKRYHSLNWSNGKRVPMPCVLQYSSSIEGTEEGLFWDMLSQTANRLKKDSSILGGCKVQHMYLTGQSQSGAYINTYIKYFDRYLKMDENSHLFDGYLNIVAIGLGRTLRQEVPAVPLTFASCGQLHPAVPYIALGSEGDVTLFKTFFNGHMATISIPQLEKDDNCVCYQLAGSPHFDVFCPVIQSDEDILKAGRTPHAIPDETDVVKVNNVPLAYYVNGMLEKLHHWATTGEKPEKVAPFEVDAEDNLLKDEYGNTKGGLRSPYVDLPVATYQGCDTRYGIGATGLMTFISKEAFHEKYGNVEKYISKFETYANKQCTDGWLTPEDTKRMVKDETKIIEEQFK